MRAPAVVGSVLTLLVAGAAWARVPTQGSLQLVRADAQPSDLPLERTDVAAEVTGSVARVRVTQTFHNPYPDPIEAIYVFPLPDDAAVGDMTITIGNRVIRSLIKRRDDARRMYDQARQVGKTAALLEQERDNVFTQSVANILPGGEIRVDIVYDEVLRRDRGVYELVFPMVVGPRYIPETVADAARIAPPVLEPGSRNGHDIGIEVLLRGGLAVQDWKSPTHAVDVRAVPGGTVFSLAGGDAIPNQDFVLRWTLATEKSQPVVYAHADTLGGHFLLYFEPPAPSAKVTVTPKEMVFIVDTSGSMDGEPIALVKRAMRHAIANLNRDDTFQIIRFDDRASTFATGPVANTPDNRRQALSYINGMSGGGGTRMLSGIEAALDYPPSGRLRIVCLMTDGYIGNEAEILDAIASKIDPDTRIFAFGVGSAVNRYLIDEMAIAGRGAAQYVLLDGSPEAQVARFYDRVRSPILTHIEIDWGGLRVAETTPVQVPDLFAGEPLRVLGRYAGQGRGVVKIRGKVGGQPVTLEVPVALPASESGNAAVASLWARGRIGELSRNGETAEKIIELALSYRLVSRYTSFVAIEEKVVNDNGTPRTIEVPVEMPEGVSYEGVYGATGGHEVLMTPSVAGAVDMDAAYFGQRDWVLRLGGALGTESTASFHLDLIMPLSPRLGVGTTLTLAFPREEAERILGTMIQMVFYPLARLHVDVASGLAIGLDRHIGFAYGAVLGFDLVSRTTFMLGLELRYDGAYLTGPGETVHTVTLGLQLGWR